jgi:hypothetical protein
MTRLQTEIQRLYLPLGTPPIQPGTDLATLLCPRGHTRAGVLSLARPAHWDSLLRVWQCVQADLGLPAPAIAVNGVDGYQLWFSLLEPVPANDMAAFLSGLQATYLSDIAPRRLGLWPLGQSPLAGTGPLPALAVPAPQCDDRWSAFVTPDLARIFADDPWLDMAPADASQADVLAALACARPDVFETACARLAAVSTPTLSAIPEPNQVLPMAPTAQPAALEPEAFLRQVMNDPGVSLALRIEAAKALLPLQGCR